jgi:AcrR family transcriptional regulator
MICERKRDQYNLVNKMDMETKEPDKLLRNKSRGAILDAGALLFSQHGYTGATLRDIAKLTNMKAGSLYYYFSSKEELVLEILTLGLGNIIDTVTRDVDALSSNACAKEILVTAVNAHLHALLEMGDYTSTTIRNYEQMPSDVQNKARVLREKYENMWRRWLQQAQEKGDINQAVDLKVLRLSLLGSLNSTLAWYKAGEFSVEEVAEKQIDIYWNGIAGGK